MKMGSEKNRHFLQTFPARLRLFAHAAAERCAAYLRDTGQAGASRSLAAPAANAPRLKRRARHRLFKKRRGGEQQKASRAFRRGTLVVWGNADQQPQLLLQPQPLPQPQLLPPQQNRRSRMMMIQKQHPPPKPPQPLLLLHIWSTSYQNSGRFRPQFILCRGAPQVTATGKSHSMRRESTAAMAV